MANYDCLVLPKQISVYALRLLILPISTTVMYVKRGRYIPQVIGLNMSNALPFPSLLPRPVISWKGATMVTVVVRRKHHVLTTHVITSVDRSLPTPTTHVLLKMANSDTMHTNPLQIDSVWPPKQKFLSKNVMYVINALAHRDVASTESVLPHLPPPYHPLPPLQHQLEGLEERSSSQVCFFFGSREGRSSKTLLTRSICQRTCSNNVWRLYVRLYTIPYHTIPFQCHPIPPYHKNTNT